MADVLNLTPETLEAVGAYVRSNLVTWMEATIGTPLRRDEFFTRFAEFEERIENRIEQLEIRMDRLETRMDRLETRVEKIETTLQDHGARLSRLELLVEKNGHAIERLDSSMMHQFQMSQAVVDRYARHVTLGMLMLMAAVSLITALNAIGLL